MRMLIYMMRATKPALVFFMSLQARKGILLRPWSICDSLREHSAAVISFFGEIAAFLYCYEKMGDCCYDSMLFR